MQEQWLLIGNLTSDTSDTSEHLTHQTPGILELMCTQPFAEVKAPSNT